MKFNLIENLTTLKILTPMKFNLDENLTTMDF